MWHYAGESGLASWEETSVPELLGAFSFNPLMVPPSEAGLTILEVLALRHHNCYSPDYNYTEGLECPREFDGWTCINTTAAGSKAEFPCPYFILGFDPTRRGHRTCLEDGTWFRHPDNNKTWSNYTTCVDTDDLQMRNQVNLIYKTGYTVSLAALVIAIIIFFYFKSLSCTRIQIHKNLFISLALNNLLWLVWYEVVVDNIPVLVENHIWCQLLHILVQYFMVATYFWMFCEGLYLHTLLVFTFLSENRVLIVLQAIGWGVPAIVVAVYAGLRASAREETVHCWIHESLYMWALSAPVCISMISNFVFLINIVRLLLTKLRTSNTTSRATPNSSFKEKNNSSVRSRRSGQGATIRQPLAPSARTRKAVRATLILIPLLGLQYLLTPFRPEQGTHWEYVYQVTSALVASCQGICVALLFCFCNGEVAAVIKKRWRQSSLSKGLKAKPWHSCSGVTSVSRNRKLLLET